MDGVKNERDYPTSANSQPPVERVISNLDELERATKDGGQYLRVKSDRIEVRLMSAAVTVLKNKFGRDEFRFPVLHERVPKTLSLTRRGAQNLVALLKVLVGSGKPVEGTRVVLTREGRGFETTYRTEVASGPDPQTPPVVPGAPVA